MSLNSTPSANRVHIGFFGMRNAGKSSVVNAVTNQDLAVVSDTKGTTTDPVSKAMELLPIGPVVIIDTPGYDDEGSLGELRVRKTKQVLNKTDIAVLVVDATVGMKAEDRELVKLFQEKKIPYVIAYNKTDLLDAEKKAQLLDEPEESGDTKEKLVGNRICVSAVQKDNIYELKELIGKVAPKESDRVEIVSDLIRPSDFIVLVVPVDTAAPKGRLILPQQQTIRDILDSGATAIVVKENGLEETLVSLGKKPAMVITDSQVFKQVAAIVPEDIPLTSFSILLARYKGFLDVAVEGVRAIETLEDGDKVLISEGCTHHRQCEDIGTVKIPKWLREYTGKDITFETSSGTGFEEELTPYKMVIHCGGCVLNEREMQYRMKCAVDQKTPFTNYGIFIAYVHGILKRSVEIFPHLYEQL